MIVSEEVQMMETEMDSKKVISAILQLEDWKSFEDFVFELYKQSNHQINIQKNYRTRGKSGRIREVDVLITFGITPHKIVLGVECKYWKDKVDGDVIDVAVGKKNDLGIDKYAIITTKGYESGAESAAKAAGIDLFLVRPIHDDDFGYTGKVVKFRFLAYASAVEKVSVQSQLIAEASDTAKYQKVVSERLGRIAVSNKAVDLDPTFDLYRVEMSGQAGSLMTLRKLSYLDNLSKLVDKERLQRTKAFFEGNAPSLEHEIRFKSQTALFLDSRAALLMNSVRFRIRYFLDVWEFEIDRGEHHPAVIENIIERTIVPLRREKEDTSFRMDGVYEVGDADYSQTPDGVIGREGVNGHLLVSYPMDPSKIRSDAETYELTADGDVLRWTRVQPITEQDTE